MKLLLCIKSLSESLKLIEIGSNLNSQSSLNETFGKKHYNFQSINSLTDSLIFTDKK